MTAVDQGELASLIEAANGIGARPFKGATGDWSTAVEVALLDTLLSIGANAQGNFGAGVLPRLRAFKAFRGPANMMRVVATLGPFGLADFVPAQHQIDQIMTAAAGLLDAGVNTAADVDPHSDTQREALVTTLNVPAIAWEFFLSSLGSTEEHVVQQQRDWLERFVARATGRNDLTDQERDALLEQASQQLNAEHQRKSFGIMPEFTVEQLRHAMYRAEYARATHRG